MLSKLYIGVTIRVSELNKSRGLWDALGGGGGVNVRKRDKKPPSYVWIYVYELFFFLRFSLVSLLSEDLSMMMCVYNIIS